eukprot:2640764-Pyramimonas_sp.AAC.1
MDHGFLGRRRQEDAIVANICISWRLNKVGLHWIDSHEDLSNAFASPSWPAAGIAVEGMTKGSERRFCQQRYKLACTAIPADRGDTHLRTGCGMIQGGPFAAASFVH